MKRIAGVLLALAIVAGACGDDDDSAEAVDETPTEEPTPAGDDAAAEPTDEPADGSTDEPAEEPTEAVELTATFTGVTEDEIRYGLAGIDTEQVRDVFGIDLGVVPVEEMYAAWSDALNERGGVLGRSVTPYYRFFLPVGATESDKACTELIEDDKTFVVIGQFLGDNALCVTELKGHPYVGHFGENPERQERSEGRLFATEMEATRQRTGGTQAMIDAGDFDGRNVALYWETATDSGFADAVRPLLEEAGVNVVSEAEAPDVGSDTVAIAETRDVIVQRFIADGADLLLNLSNINFITEAVDRAGADMTIAFTNGQAADRTIFPDAVASDETKANTFAITTDKPTAEEALADPEVQRCIEEYDAAYPDEPLDLEDDNIVNGITNHCRAFALMVTILEAAGAELTPETFVAAAEGLGTFDLPAMANASLGPDKHSAGTNVRRYEYDTELGYHVPVGDPIPTE